MIFNQLEFLFLFLPLTLLVSLFVLKGSARFWCLTAASLLFYGFSGLTHALVLGFDILWVFAVTRGTRFRKNVLLLWAAILPPLFGLVYFKYTGFILEGTPLGALVESDAEISAFFSNVVLPAGISFFTFQLIAFAIDRYNSDPGAEMDFKTFALFVSFFPQLVAGPIVRPSQVADQFAALGNFRLSLQDLVRATGYIVIGLALKVLLADSLARYAGPMEENPGELTSGAAAYVGLAYSFRIYFDFYGYSLIAIGLALLFGIRLPDNFNRPYSAVNPRDFWRRWHMTLSYWIRDYLYIPLGGNKAYIRNIVITFAICGLWHGAAWTFVVWGLYHAALVSGYGLCSSHWDRMPRVVQQTLNFSLVSLGWILFIFSFGETGQFLVALTGFGGSFSTLTFEHWGMLGIAALVCFFLRPETVIEKVQSSGMSAAVAGVLMGVVLFGTLLFVGLSDSFIYFRF